MIEMPGIRKKSCTIDLVARLNELRCNAVAFTSKQIFTKAKNKIFFFNVYLIRVFAIRHRRKRH